MAPSPADHSWRVQRLSPGMVELMSLLVSSHPLQHRGGSTGPMAPSPAITPQVSSPSSSMARPPTPARLMKTAPQQCLQTSPPTSHPHHHTGGSLGSMAPSPANLRVSRPSSSWHKLLRLLVRQRQRLHNTRNLRLPPLRQLYQGGEQAWQSIELPPSSSVGSGASGSAAGSTSRLY